MKTIFKKNGGFTLVELIVVIAILAILAAVAIPAYSGYIEKANRAGDEQLLAAINRAFASACLENGVSQYEIGSANLPVKKDGTLGTLSSVKFLNGQNAPSSISGDFGEYLAGNENAVFKSFKALKIVNGNFVEATISDAYYALMGTFKSEDITALNNSTFGQMGVSNLLGSAGFASGVAADLLTNGTDDRITAMVYTQANYDTLAKVLGFESMNDEGFGPALQALVTQKTNQMKTDPKYAGLSADELNTAAMDAIMANNAVLSAATNANFNHTAFMDQLVNGSAKDAINANLTGDGDRQMGLSQAALTYALYASYAQQNGIEISEETALGSVIDAMSDPNFIAYVDSDQGKADANGYLAGMNMVNSSYDNKNVATDILINGFDNEDLTALLQNTLG